jgi:hypothetical protein
MRALSLVLVMLAAGGCNNGAGFDFIEIHGSLADGATVTGHNLASTAVVPSLLPALGTVVAVGAPFDGPEDLAGYRIEWQPGAITAGASFPSDPNGPVVFYVSNMVPDGGANDQLASVVNGGTITFTSVVGKKTTGTLSNLVLVRGGVTLSTVDTGSFQATQP